MISLAGDNEQLGCQGFEPCPNTLCSNGCIHAWGDFPDAEAAAQSLIHLQRLPHSDWGLPATDAAEMWS